MAIRKNLYLVSDYPLLEFLENEPDLYSVSDLKVRYKRIQAGIFKYPRLWQKDDDREGIILIINTAGDWIKWQDEH